MPRTAAGQQATVEEARRWANELPRHRVRISPAFYLGTYEVTQGQWRAVMGNNLSAFPQCGAECPVENVSWEDVQDFIRRLNAREGHTKYRLPTEAEWEYAARAGTETPMYTEELRILGKMNAPVPNVIAWYGGNGGVTYAGGVDCSEWQKKQYRSDTCGPHPVGRKQANQFGLYDMLGNVWEWVQDRYGEYPAGLVTDPPGPASGSSWRVNRGGSWYSYAGDSRSAARRLLRRPRPLSRLSPAEDGSVTLCTVTLLPSAGFLAWRPEGREVQGRRPWSRRFFHRTGCCWPECSRCVLIPYWARLMMAPGGTSSKTKRCSRSATTFLSNIQ